MMSLGYKKGVIALLTLLVLMAAFQDLSFAENKKSAGGREVIGRWRDDSMSQISSSLELYRQNGQYYLDYRFDKDGSKATYELRKEKAKKGSQQFRRITHPGDYYVITKDNSLESWDSMGLVFTARPIK